MSRRTRFALALTVVAGLLVGCSSSSADEESGPTTAPDATADDATADDSEGADVDPLTVEPERTDRECHRVEWDPTTPPPANATCYWVTVPADWSEPDGDQVRLPVAVLAATGDAPQPDPIVAPGGGPGFPASHHYWWAETEYNVDRDVIVYDQRGTGRAEPSLACPEVGEARIANFQRVEPFDVELAGVVDAAKACRERIEADGVDLDDYDSVASAYDLDAIRRALGYDEWNIIGVSYGARLGLTALRSTPDAVRSVILDSVVDVTAGGIAANAVSGERAINILFDVCAEQPDCNDRYPDLEAQLDQVVERYDADPIEVEMDLDDGNGTQRYLVSGTDAIGGLHLALYEVSYITLLPSLISALAEGDTSIVEQMLREGIARQTSSAHAMEWSVDCADNAGVNGDDIALQADPGRSALIAMEPNCEAWPVEPTAPDFNDPVVSDVPALVLAGGFDPVTPDIGSEAAAEHLSGSTFVRFPWSSHRVGTSTPCADEISLAFLADPSAPVDTSCVADVPPMEFA